ncbi:uncharacterized protein BKA55DRAFT_566993 [Fusarium redolens]|uniref:Uncharacterized protein n=1 Tax=Fusarium redolens TaxID=48865 RepID=A0A9P9HBK9_FUSRE|nr:uncharacterized protein BKA55DRAFT_566993 [Fusarium redolens]KAH7254102.1 hypothetical protein BKA55DRAFT_566993 [Fusarium redolens]
MLCHERLQRSVFHISHIDHERTKLSDEVDNITKARSQDNEVCLHINEPLQGEYKEKRYFKIQN